MGLVLHCLHRWHDDHKGGPVKHLPTRGALLAAALVTAACAITACGGPHTAKATAKPGNATPTVPATSASTPATPSGSPLVGASPALTEEQLTTVAETLTQTGAPGLTEDTSAQSTGVSDEKQKVSSGGPSCATFMNALQSYAPTYAASAEVDRGYAATTTSGKESVLVSLVSHTSAADAHRTVEDVRTSAKSCPHLTAALDGATGRMNLAPLAQPVMGDDSAVVRIGMTQQGAAELVTTAVAQVGSTTVMVFDISPKTYDYGVTDQVTKQAVTILSSGFAG